jgi:hypothetical protein
VASPDIIRIEFDQNKRILHLSFTEKYSVRTKAQLEQDVQLINQLLESYAKDEPIYLILDINNLIIDPDLAGVYAKCAEQLTGRFVYPGGVARYGSQITRITVKRAHRDYLERDPALFFTRDEAFAYIERVRQESSGSEEATELKRSRVDSATR